ncbi:MAG: lauroyl acyltransferase [Hyphomicrobiales bacterium]|nr:MAG: lauroyl acyltransferase [Hyphomicrobiales bacterium]
MNAGMHIVKSEQPRPPRLVHYIEYVALRAMFWLVRALPLNIAKSISETGVRKIAPLTRRHTRVLDHLRHALPERTETERRKIADEMWRNVGTIAIETLVLDRLAAEPDRFSFEYNGVDEVIRAAPNGCIYVACHYGNWEVLPLAAHDLKRSLAGVYKQLSNPLSEHFLKELREPFYQGGLFPKGYTTARQVLSLAKQGKDIAVLADLRDTRGVEVPFFGRNAWATPFPALIARTYDRPLIAVRPRRIGPSRFRFELEQIDVPRTDDRAADIKAATAAVHAVFERWIRECPDQWFWTHRKWDYATNPPESGPENSSEPA